MKKHILFIFMLLAFSMIATAQNKKIAILEPIDREGNVPYGVKLQLRSNLTYAISNTPGYVGYDRVDMAQIMGEHDFQRTGLVSDAQIRKLGEMTGCTSILVTEAAVYDQGQIILTAKILNVETANVENSTPAQITSTKPDELQRACVRLARMLLGNNTTGENTIITEPQETDYNVPSSNNMIMTKEGDFYYLGNVKMNKEEYADFLQSNCLEAYTYHMKGCKKTKTGKTLLMISGGFIIAGGLTELGFLIIDDGLLGYAIKPALLGATLTAVSSTPFFIIGNHKKNKAIINYNENCAWSTASLNFGFTANGVGVCLNF